jgi:hypothetical protein
MKMNDTRSESQKRVGYFLPKKKISQNTNGRYTQSLFVARVEVVANTGTHVNASLD